MNGGDKIAWGGGQVITWAARTVTGSPRAVVPIERPPGKNGQSLDARPVVVGMETGALRCRCDRWQKSVAIQRHAARTHMMRTSQSADLCPSSWIQDSVKPPNSRIFTCCQILQTSGASWQCWATWCKTTWLISIGCPYYRLRTHSEPA